MPRPWEGPPTPDPSPAGRGEGERSFVPVATRLAAIAAQVLGWRPGEFWAATPAELALSLGVPEAGDAPPSRAELMIMIERERDDRSD